MAQALYRKYRSKAFSEIVGQEHITTTLQNALSSGNISHAYLFTGPRGIGKTSIARIFAHAVNQLPYEGQAHLDIIEIDAASNRRIDEVRDLRDKVHILPSQAAYKVYIIDEVHMLTREAFNALLKTLEEPPAHIIFILATTEAHKLPDTIISRTQHFAFKPLSEELLSKHLSAIAKSEKLDVDTKALQLIARHGNGSVRDSISLLDQVRHLDGRVTADDVRQLLGIAPQTSIQQIIDIIISGQPQQLLELLTNLRQQGVTAPQIANQLGAALREQLLDGRWDDIDLLRKLLDVPANPNAERLLELILLEPVISQQLGVKKSSRPPTDSPSSETATPKPVSPKKIERASDEYSSQPMAIEREKRQNEPALGTAEAVKSLFSLERWPDVLAAVKGRYNTLYGILRMAEPELDGDRLILSFRFAFHEKQLKDSKNHRLITDIIREIGGGDITIDCRVQTKSAPVKPAANALDIQAVSNIFGGGEVLES